jgi:hypothetical protein
VPASLSPQTKSTRLAAWTLALGVIGGTLYQGARILTRQRADLQQAQQRTARLQQELAVQSRTHEAARRELTLAESQLNELSRLSLVAASFDSRSADPEFASWIARSKRLRQLVEQHADQRIPEMRVLTDDDWLLVARRSKLNSEEDVRQALAAIRTAAKDRFVASLTEAIRRFIAAATPDQSVAVPRPGRGGAPGDGGVTLARIPPVTVMDLAPYLQNPADAEVLTRLALFPNDSGWKLQEKDAIDPEYDGGYWISANARRVSGGVTRAPWAWLPPDFNERSLRASSAYIADHNGLHSPGFAETLRYFDPPLEPAIAEKILKAEQDRQK